VKRSVHGEGYVEIAEDMQPGDNGQRGAEGAEQQEVT
jgi:hypothetical protein